MQLTEQHVINRDDPRFAVIDAATFKSKNLYNAGNDEVRQSYIHTGKYLNYNEVQRRMQSHEAYKALLAKEPRWRFTLQDCRSSHESEKLAFYSESKPSIERQISL